MPVLAQFDVVRKEVVIGRAIGLNSPGPAFDFDYEVVMSGSAGESVTYRFEKNGGAGVSFNSAEKAATVYAETDTLPLLLSVLDRLDPAFPIQVMVEDRTIPTGRRHIVTLTAGLVRLTN